MWCGRAAHAIPERGIAWCVDGGCEERRVRAAQKEGGASQRQRLVFSEVDDRCSPLSPSQSRGDGERHRQAVHRALFAGIEKGSINSKTRHPERPQVIRRPTARCRTHMTFTRSLSASSWPIDAVGKKGLTAHGAGRGCRANSSGTCNTCTALSRLHSRRSGVTASEQTRTIAVNIGRDFRMKCMGSLCWKSRLMRTGCSIVF